MAVFTNTVDVLGDNVVTDSIIDRSITEYKDNNITSVGAYAFNGCSSLTSVYFPAAKKIGEYAFSGCSSLTSVDLQSAADIGQRSFYQCSALGRISAPKATILRASAFGYCSSLICAYLPALKTIYAGVFRYCEKLKSVDLTAATGIGSDMFNNCTNLTRVYAPLATNINSSSFYGCTSLTHANFPSATFIGSNAFERASNLTALTLRSETMCSLNHKSAFDGTPIKRGTGYIYVPSALVDTYKADSNWSTYANQIRAIEDYPVEANGKYSWEAVAHYIDAGTYATEYAVGDTILMDLDNEGLVEMEIVAFDTDDKASGGKAPITFIAKNLLANDRRYNPASSKNTDGTYQSGTGTVGGWEASELRAYLRDTLSACMPSSLADRIVEVTKSQSAHDTSGAVITQTSTETIWIPGDNDMDRAGLYSAKFPDNESRIRCKYGSSTGETYFIRDVENTVNWQQTIAASGAGGGTNSVTTTRGVLIGFCVG